MQVKKRREHIKPNLICSIKKIEVTLQEGEKIKGAFKLSNTVKGIILKGQIYSPLQEIHLNKTFFDDNSEIQYSIKAFSTKMTKKESYIQIISNAGELKIPVVIKVESPSIQASIGRIKDLKQFVNLAENNWQEAVEIFTTKAFEEVVLIQQPELIQLYSTLLKSSLKDQALEEFLITANKKNSVKLSLTDKEKKYKIVNVNEKDEIIIKKDNWGYVDVNAKVNVPFIRLEKNTLTQSSFIDGEASIKYIILHDRLHFGLNEGCIILETLSQKLTLTVQVMKPKMIDIYLDQMSYTLNDEGSLIISNPYKQKFDIKITPIDKWIELQNENYEVTESLEIPFAFKQQQKTIGKWLKSNFVSKELVVLSGLKVKVTSEKHNFEKKISVKIALHTFANTTF